MRPAGLIVWGLCLAGSLLLLWLGVYRVVSPALSSSPVCVGVDVPWVAAGVLANLVAAAVAVVAFRAGWWALAVAAPGMLALAVTLLLPCSFALQLALPFAALVAIGAAVGVIARSHRRRADPGGDPELTRPRR